jgi:hypothetical protein
LGFDPFAGRKDDDGPIEDAEAPFDLRREVDVTGCIEEIDIVILPAEFNAGGEDGDPPFLFFGVIIGVGRTVIDTADAVFGAADEEHPFGNRCLAGIDVGDDADVADAIDSGGHGAGRVGGNGRGDFGGACSNEKPRPDQIRPRL